MDKYLSSLPFFSLFLFLFLHNSFAKVIAIVPFLATENLTLKTIYDLLTVI